MWREKSEKKEAGLRERSLANVVFMGMGEPLLNLDAVLKGITLLTMSVESVLDNAI